MKGNENDNYAGSRFVHFFGKQPLCCSVSCCTMATKKDALYSSVNVFSTKVLIGDTLFYVSNWRRDRHFPWSSEPREGLAACTAKGVTSLLSYFETLSIGPTPGIEPATSRSAVNTFYRLRTDGGIYLTRTNNMTPWYIIRRILGRRFIVKHPANSERNERFCLSVVDTESNGLPPMKK